jgi:hypothetical protein
MQMFEFQEEVVGDYGEYIESFGSIAHPKIRQAGLRRSKKETNGSGYPLNLHIHQEETIRPMQRAEHTRSETPYA